MTGIEGVEGRDYEISVSGYRNYVHEMERMLDEEADSVRSLPRREPLRRAETRTSSVQNSEAGLGGSSRPRGLRAYASRDDLRPPAARNEAAGVVQDSVLEDGPSRTISMWRERVAQSQSSDERPPAARGPGPLHRRQPSSDALHAPPSRSTERSSGCESKSKSKSKGSSGDYERTEYIISYQQPGRNGPVTQQVYTASEVGLTSPRSRRRGSSGSKQHASPRRSAAKAYEHTESVMTYLHTPPHSQNSSRSSPKSLVAPPPKPPPSPPHNGASVPVPVHDTGGPPRVAASSPIDLILGSCEPSLLHIGPALSDLGICKMEHLRAVKRLTEETRDRELREPALKKGVTVMEWAILLDKILTL
ncbi:hypothetical protein PHLGIDRAFT_444326 [Phlebiopsis gigantea 11061_1 CR5-6]|uniref:Uncharacterized protein n=1 Tax=Phlebiopsis gigantea (strain 11061_1 CR5-6) TaxID=745531 RepID=A0A0C3PKK2_PHLG1|nr:hypothetical protein PHLGIDRAFT_444326 [Phlebiopsis gigantea 11061_1 CR5-6]